MSKITIYGLAGTGKGAIGRLLSEKLNIQYQSAGDLMRENAKKLGITLQELKEKRKLDPTWDHKLDEYIKYYGENNNNFIFESRLPWYFIPDSFKIKLTCDLDERVRRISNRDKTTIEETKKETIYRDQSDKDLYHKLYGIEDMNADEHFDYILDTSSNTVEELVDQIISKLNELAVKNN